MTIRRRQGGFCGRLQISAPGRHAVWSPMRMATARSPLLAGRSTCLRRLDQGAHAVECEPKTAAIRKQSAPVTAVVRQEDISAATVVIAADHFARGVFWPESVYGIAKGAGDRSRGDEGNRVRRRTPLVISTTLGMT
jgi:hypothetical protein